MSEGPTVLEPLALTLRPLRVGELLDRAIYFYRLHFVPLVAFSALLLAPIALLTALLTVIPSLLLFRPDAGEVPSLVEGISLLSLFGGTSLQGLFAYLLLPLQVAGVGAALRASLLDGQPVTLAGMIGAVREQWRPLVGTGLLAMILAVPVTCTLVIPPIGLAISALYAFAILLAALVVLYERRTGLEAIKRGWNLIRGSAQQAAGYLLLYYLFSLILGSILSVGLTLLSQAVSSDFLSMALLTGGQSFASLLTSLFLGPLQYAVAAHLYFDLRVRHEGLDVALAMAQAAGEPLDLATAPASEEPLLHARSTRAVLTLAGLFLALIMLLCGLFGLMALVLTAVG